MNAAERLLRDLSLLLELCLVSGEQEDLDQLVEKLVERVSLKICASGGLMFVRSELIEDAGSKRSQFFALPHRSARYLLASRVIDGVATGIEQTLAHGRVEVRPGASSVGARARVPGLRTPGSVLSLPIRDIALLEIYANDIDALDEHTGHVLGSLSGWLAHRIRGATQQSIAKSRLLTLGEARQSYERLVGGLPGVVWQLDARGRVIYVSDRSTELFGFTRERLTSSGDPRLLLIREADRDRVLDELSRAIAARRSEVLLAYRVWRGGKQGDDSLDIEERVGLSYGNSGELRAQIGFLSDVTISRAAMRRIEQVTAQRSAVARADALRLDSERATRAKTEFLNLLSHELRAPLFPIIALSDLLLRVDDEELKRGEWRDQLRMINGAGKQMLQLVTDLLDLSRVDAGKTRPNPGPIILSHFLAAVDQRMQERAKAKGATLTSVLHPDSKAGEIYTDRGVLDRISTSLVTHAIESAESQDVRLEIEGRETSVAVRVTADRPAHIAKVEDSMFEPFWERSDPPRAEARGQSLALAVVKRMARAFGGDVGARSEGHALIFEAELPCARADLRFRFERVPRTVIGSAELAAVFAVSLEAQAMGADVKIVPSVGELVDLAKRRAFDLLLVDVRLPGLRLLEELLLAERAAATFHPHVVGLSRPGDPRALTGVVADQALVLPPSKERLAAILSRF